MPGYIYSVVDLGRQVNKIVVKGMSTALALAKDIKARHDLAVTGRLFLV